ncbi:MAG: tetratricopeptide repeat protein, partial [Gallionella sp.]
MKMKKTTLFSAVACCLALLFAHPSIADHNSMHTPSLDELIKQGEAVRLARQAIVDAERAYGVNHVKVADRLDKMAQVFEKQRKYAAAEPFLKRALKIREAGLGADNIAVA